MDMILAISIRPTLFHARPGKRRSLRTLLLVLAATLPVVAASVL